MTRTEFAIAKELWMYVRAWDSFKKVEDSCRMIRGIESGQNAFANLLMAGTIVFYCRPFKGGTGVPRLPPLIVPSKYNHIHEIMIRQRDKNVAHTDSGFFELAGVTRANEVSIDVRGKSIRYTINQFSFTAKMLTELQDLARELKNHCLCKMESSAAHLPSFLTLQDGTYLLNILQADQPTFMRISS